MFCKKIENCQITTFLSWNQWKKWEFFASWIYRCYFSCVIINENKLVISRNIHIWREISPLASLAVIRAHIIKKSIRRGPDEKYWAAETSEILVSREFSFSLLVLDLEPFQFHFHFSKKSEGILFFTFHFSKKVKAIHISLFFLEKKEWNQVRAITSPLSLFPIVFPKIVKSQVSTSLKILAKFQFQNLDQTLCSKSEPNISLKKVTKTRLKFNCAHLRSTKESLTFKYFDTGRYWLVLGQYRTVRVDIW